jgi:hypothetical protein
VVSSVETDILVSSMSNNVHAKFGSYTFDTIESALENNFTLGWQHWILLCFRSSLIINPCFQNVNEYSYQILWM